MCTVHRFLRIVNTPKQEIESRGKNRPKTKDQRQKPQSRHAPRDGDGDIHHFTVLSCSGVAGSATKEPYSRNLSLRRSKDGRNCHSFIRFLKGAINVLKHWFAGVPVIGFVASSFLETVPIRLFRIRILHVT